MKALVVLSFFLISASVFSKDNSPKDKTDKDHKKACDGGDLEECFHLGSRWKCQMNY